MRLFDNDNDRSLQEVTVYLDRTEAEQLISYLEQLLADPTLHHAHLNSPDSQKEFTVTIYDINNPELLNTFDERSKRLILQDE